MKIDEIRKNLGVTLIDLPHYAWHIYITDRWERLSNRSDTTESSPDGPGMKCGGRWTSDLLTCRIYPFLGKSMMRRAFHRWPIKFSDHPEARRKPLISVIIAFRGEERLDALMTVLSSLAGQEGADFECILVEQSREQEVKGLPGWVKYVRAVHPSDPIGWYKSWAYNIGAREANGDILVFHDADICMPKHYLKEVALSFVIDDLEMTALQRFLFYLDERDSRSIETGRNFAGDTTPKIVLQNWQGGTIAVRKDAFFSIGGFDEGFVNWGGEDCEFFDRCLSLKHYSYGYIPFIHLWHVPQSDRHSEDNINTLRILPDRLGIPARTRIEEMRGRRCGDKNGPDPLLGYPEKYGPRQHSQKD